MSIGKFFKSIFYTKFLGEETIKKSEEIFQWQRKQFPNEDTHVHLAQVYISRLTAHGKDPNDPSLQTFTLNETFLFACLPVPLCAKALGLYLLFKERPDIVEQYPTFQEEYAQLMQPVFQAQENGTLEGLYRRYNPKMSAFET